MPNGQILDNTVFK